MRIPERDTAVFSTSAIDLFASALGAFILLVMLLFPYYRNAGPAEAYSRTEALMAQRRLASGRLDDLNNDRGQAELELERLQASNRRIEARVARRRAEVDDVRRQADTLTTAPPLAAPVATPAVVSEGVEFSILGLATESKSFVIVIDMSGSMINYEALMLGAVEDLLAPFDADNRFALLGFQGNPQPLLWRFPGAGEMLAGTPENLRQAREFLRGLTRKFVGSTPTHFALQAALEYPANAIILVSDGEPNTPPGYIIESITGLNQFRRTELHTVAIGDYTHNRNLVLFMQTLARLNNGDFVGVSR